jgi:hypothetical protein
MRVFLVDGTYELFRHYYGVPPHRTADGAEVAATRGVLWSMLRLVEQGVTHLGVATDHVIESFRNRLWPAYKSSAGLDPQLLGQFGLLEVALEAMGVVVWPMVELEADDALAGAAAAAADDPRVEQVVICTPDKDLGQCVRGGRVVQLDRRNRVVYDEARVTAKFGVAPASIPDYLALVGDSADGLPGPARLGGQVGRGRARPLRHHRGHPRRARAVGGGGPRPPRPGRHPAGPAPAGHALQGPGHPPGRPLAAPRGRRLRWAGPTPLFGEVCQRIDARSLATAAARVAGRRRA